MARFKPHRIVSIHAPFGVLDFDGPSVPPTRLGRLYLDQVGIYPERVLAECEAKRRIVGIHELDPIEVYSWGTTGGGCGLCDHSCETGGDTWGHDPCETLKALALPYADHPDYRQEWKP